MNNNNHHTTLLKMAVMAVRALLGVVNVIVAGVLYLSFCLVARMVGVLIFVVLWWWCL